MSFHLNPLVLALRRIGRQFGLNRLVARLRGRDGYEEKFDSAVRSVIRQGDCIWDVGANIGHYSEKFAGWCGPSGMVVAFEPHPNNLERLRTRVGILANVKVVSCGLGSKEALLPMVYGGDDKGATSRIVENPSEGDTRTVHVRVARGDVLVDQEGMEEPDVVKIDTEGFEWEVVIGLGVLLGRKRLRAVCMEVHFAILEERGDPQAPRRIVDELEAKGFAVSWPDASHLLAVRERLTG